MPLKIKSSRIRWLVPIIGSLFLITGLFISPPGLLGKMDALAYSVCHRLEEHSFFLGERPLPLCARCSGLYLGILVGLIYLVPRRKAGLPNLRIGVGLGLFAVAYVVDGFNSFADLAYQTTLLYPPQNMIRVFTGALMGTDVAVMLTFVFQQTVWKEPDPRPVISSCRDLLFLSGVSLFGGLMLLLENPLLSYPLAVISGMTVLVFFTLLHTALWVMISKQWNSFESWRDLKWILVLGATSTLAQVFLIDLARYSLTGTWAGFFH